MTFGSEKRKEMKKLKTSTIKSYTFKQIKNHVQRYTEYHETGYRVLGVNHSVDIYEEHGDMYVWCAKFYTKEDLVEFMLDFIY